MIVRTLWSWPARGQRRAPLRRCCAGSCGKTLLDNMCLEYAAPTVRRAGAIMQRPAIVHHRTSRCEGLVRRADINVALLVEGEFLPAEGPIFALRFVDDWDVRRDIFVVDVPIEVLSGAIGGITGEPLGLQAKALLCSLNHRLGGADLRLPDGP